jgi:hypothetical protein
LIFDEKLIDGKFDYRDWSNLNVVRWSLGAKESAYKLETFEAYGFRYVAVLALA